MDNEGVPKKTAVLVVDDDEDILQILELALSAHGFRVVLSRNGAGVREIIARIRPDVILLDIQMDGVDGREICRSLKSNPGTSIIPVLMFSAMDDLHSISQDCGANGSIQKPFDLAKVKAGIAQVLGSHR